MSPLIVGLLIAFVAILLLISFYGSKQDAQLVREFIESEQEAAFDDDLSFPISPDIVAKTKNLVDRAGVVENVGRTTDYQGRSRTVPMWEVYVLDVNGAFHEVSKTMSEVEAAEIALEVAESYDVSLDDPDGITAGRD